MPDPAAPDPRPASMRRRVDFDTTPEVIPTAPVTAEDLRERIGNEIAFHLGYRSSRATDAVMGIVTPVVERYRKAVEDAPGGAIWTGACVECGTAIQPGDAITWRLRWSPQGPMHEECR